ncbi:MAG: prepilin-type N-terminal cleavage/methylation domain-containing protein [Kiritimatiellia bacterium]
MKKGFTLVEIMIVVAIIGLLAAIAIPSFMKARTSSQKNACINNLRQIESGKDQYSIEVGRTNGWTFGSDDAIAFSNLVGVSSGYIKIAPACPASSSDCAKGTLDRAVADYSVMAIGSNPWCRVSTDHRL